jgi:hypothetical protein
LVLKIKQDGTIKIVINHIFIYLISLSNLSLIDF